ncbi:MAG: Nif11-like leader peptide family natural product precursor [Magnetococcales bacterium]|nr:Nif11-like leader peptide family natural product precursor [Magnetococcales bacterium]
MTIESAQSYAERIIRDQVFADRVALCKNHDERTALAEAEGYFFTADEAKTVKSNMIGRIVNACCRTGGTGTFTSSKFVSFKIESCDYC